MPDCPKCRIALVRRKNDFGVFWHCSTCEGSAVTMSLLRKVVERDAINGLWQRARMGSYPRKHACPGCTKPMEEISVDADGKARKIDVCTSCQFVWLDDGEWADLAYFVATKQSPEDLKAAVRARIAQTRQARSTPPPIQATTPLPVRTVSKPPPLMESSQPVSVPPPLKVKAERVVERKRVTYAQSTREGTSLKDVFKREGISKGKSKREPNRRRPSRESKAPRRSGESPISRTMSKPEPIRRRSVIQKSDRSRSGWGGEPTHFWQWLPALLGMPVEDEQPFGRMDKADKPWLTWVLAFAVGLVSLLAMLDLRSIVDAYGLIPAEYGRMGGLTWLTAFFLHGGLLHLIGNLYFLVIFGDNVEKCLGSMEFFFLLCFATVCGHFFHILLDPESMVPCIGASGGISGVIAFYALRFPKTQLAMMFWFIFKTYWWRMSAIWMFGIWVVFQFVIAGQQMAGVSSVSGGAHLGGALAGAFAWLFWRLNARADDLPSRYERS